MLRYKLLLKKYSGLDWLTQELTRAKLVLNLDKKGLYK